MNEEKLYINIDLEEENSSPITLFTENLNKMPETELPKKSFKQTHVKSDKKKVLVKKLSSDQQLYNKNSNELHGDHTKIWTKPEVEFPESYLKKRESVDKRKAKKASLENNNVDSNNGREVELPEGKVKQPIDYLVTDCFLNQNIVKSYEGRVRLYDKRLGYFKELSETELHVAIRKSLPKEVDMKLNKNKISEVVHRIQTNPELQLEYEDFDRNVHLINFRDVVLDTNTGETYPHNPDYLFTSFIDADYKERRIKVIRPNGNNKAYRSYLDNLIQDCTEGDPLKAKSLQQVTGYIISNEWRAKKFFVLLGLPHSGKSVWLSIWQALIGNEHTTSMSLNQIGSTRFMTAELFRSKLNITSELDENGKIQGTAVIKAITGGDLLTAERKGEHPFHFYGRTKLVAAGNYMPPVNKLDGTSAFTDRLHFLMFNHPIPEEKRDKKLLNKILSDQERTEIIHWALEGLEELKKQNFVFTESKDAKRFKQQYIDDLNNVPEFIQDMCIVDINNHEFKVQRKHLYPAYLDYCQENGIRAISKNEFYAEINKIGVKADKFRMYGSNALRGFRGIKLIDPKSDWSNNSNNE